MDFFTWDYGFWKNIKRVMYRRKYLEWHIFIFSTYITSRIWLSTYRTSLSKVTTVRSTSFDLMGSRRSSTNNRMNLFESKILFSLRYMLSMVQNFFAICCPRSNLLSSMIVVISWPSINLKKQLEAIVTFFDKHVDYQVKLLSTTNIRLLDWTMPGCLTLLLTLVSTKLSNKVYEKNIYRLLFHF